MATPQASARRVAFDCLLKWNSGRAFAETLVDQLSTAARLSASDKSLVRAIVFGCLRHKSLLEHIISTLRQGKLDERTRILLVIGMCQIFILDVPPHAAVNETVNIAPAKARALVNAIMRNALRNKESITASIPSLPLAVRFSTPEWLINRWVKNLGEEKTQTMLEYNQQPSRVFGRLNPLKPLSSLPDGVLPLENVPGWVSITQALPVKAIQNGSIYIADPSTRHAVELLAPKPDERILDACAAPGGKSAAIIALSHGQAHLTATDLHDHRLPTMLENLHRQGSDRVETGQADWALSCPPPFVQAFDAVLLDVPCSNSGVIGRRVDVRWRLSQEEINRLATLQMQILTHGAQAVKSGGRLVYSTCSIDEEENSLLIAQFLTKHTDFRLAKEVLVLPGQDGADGAYAALLIRA